MATYLLTQLRIALNMDTETYTDHCDCVIMKGGNIRGERDYDSNKFTLEALRSEMQDTEAVHIFKVIERIFKWQIQSLNRGHSFQVPGKVLRSGLRESWNNPNPGWIQFCDAVEVDSHGLVTSIAGAPLDNKVGLFNISF